MSQRQSGPGDDAEFRLRDDELHIARRRRAPAPHALDNQRAVPVSTGVSHQPKAVLLLRTIRNARDQNALGEFDPELYHLQTSRALAVRRQRVASRRRHRRRFDGRERQRNVLEKNRQLARELGGLAVRTSLRI